LEIYRPIQPPEEIGGYERFRQMQVVDRRRKVFERPGAACRMKRVSDENDRVVPEEQGSIRLKHELQMNRKRRIRGDWTTQVPHH